MGLWLALALWCTAAPSHAEESAEEAPRRSVEALQAEAARHQRGGRWNDAEAALKEAIEQAPSRKELYEALASVHLREGAESDAPAAPPATSPTTAEDRSPLERLSELGEETELAILAAAGLLLLIVLAFGLRRMMRRDADLGVEIDLPPGRTGTFCVRLTKTRPATRRLAPDFHPPDRSSTPFEHYGVSRETLFRGVPARSWWVVLEGRLSDGEVVAQEIEVEPAPGNVARVRFDLAPDVCLVDIALIRDGKAMTGHVAVAGDPDSLRPAKAGTVRLRLKPGRHQLLAAGEGRGAEREIEIEDLAPQRLEWDLSEGGELLFDGCDDAALPFLRGDLSVAAAALTRGGQPERGALLEARFHRDQGSIERAVERFEQAGRRLEAAELLANHGRFEDAASMFEKAGDLERAAEMYNADGDLLRAAKAYLDGGDFESAIVCCREAGEVPLLIDVLEKKGDFYEAGRLAMERSDIDRAIRSFQRVDARDENYFGACRILAEAFQKQGKDELALQKADEAMSTRSSEEQTPKLRVWHATLLDRAGRPDRALKAMESLRRELPERMPNLDTRIEGLRQRAAEMSAGSLSFRDKAFGEESRYELHEQIGSGGMGVVYRATDRRLGRDVALKRLPESLKNHPKAVELFLHEARASARLNHPNIVTVHDVDAEGGIYFITMEMLRGSNLLQLMRAKGRLTWMDAARLGIQAATGLGHAHAQGIIHRDIKSANLFFTEDRMLKILDFGLAKMAAEVRKATTVTGGTPFYMAPEQGIDTDSVDHRADLYALGVTLFELLTGRRPFEKGDVAAHHRETPAPDPRIHEIELPEAFADLIAQLLAKAPEGRPQSAEHLIRSLTALLK
ncbi:MAG: protein kinase [Deltaproteobacteria bacterium]|nr:protein kinase [Deltaproteobacteria bacterium]